MMASAPNQAGSFSRQCLRLSCAASSISRRNTRLGRTVRMPSSGGSVNSSVASTPKLMPCRLKRPIPRHLRQQRKHALDQPRKRFLDSGAHHDANSSPAKPSHSVCIK